MGRALRGLGLLMLLLAGGALGLHARMQHLLQQPVPPAPAPGSAAAQAASQLYFAYGSNMSTRYLHNVRGVRPVRSQAGRVAGHELRFLGPGLNRVEPAFAYLLPVPGGRAHGVLHQLRPEDLARIKASEGAAYEWAWVRVQLAGGAEARAQTLVRRTPGQPGQPSVRYLRWLQEGAREHGLPAAYQAWLQARPGAYLPGVSEVAGDVLQLTVMRRSGRCADALLLC